MSLRVLVVEDNRDLAENIEELFASIPAALRLKRPLDIPPAPTAMEPTAHMAALAANSSASRTKA